ncbi:CBS domain-containing protein [Hamadaea sp. NPDC051192]|uniref:CBS domain-containing protein n=1 Tax=Hamadaea sp. NPDC051192 TaxID=3154940 RepID=UPI00342C5995
MTPTATRRTRLTDQRVASIMSRPAIAVREYATLSDALTAFAASGLRHLVVVDSAGRCLGMLSDRLVAGAWAADPACFDDVHVTALLEPDQPMIVSTATIGQAAQVMHRLGTDAVVLVDAVAEPVGVLTAADLIGLLAKPSRDG